MVKRGERCQKLAEQFLLALGGQDAVEQEKRGCKELSLHTEVAKKTLPVCEAPPVGLVKERVFQFSCGRTEQTPIMKTLTTADIVPKNELTNTKTSTAADIILKNELTSKDTNKQEITSTDMPVKKHVEQGDIQQISANDILKELAEERLVKEGPFKETPFCAEMPKKDLTLEENGVVAYESETHTKSKGWKRLLPKRLRTLFRKKKA